MASELHPSVAARCAACYGDDFDVVCDAEEFAAQGARLRRFHKRRLVRAARAELEERADFMQDYETNLVACRACGLLFRLPRPSALDLENAYSDDEYAPERLAEMIAAQVRFFRHKARDLAALLPRTPRLVELGSFVGGFLESCRERGWEALGIDPGRQVTASCLERGLNVFLGTLEEAAAEGVLEPADGFAIWNTFDQLPHPGATVRLAARFVRPGGILVVRVPHGVCFRNLHARLRASRKASRPLLERLLAWNNLLGFPYLHGHAIATLDRLIVPYGFARLRVTGDVLVTLAGRATASWARAEERAVKALQRAWIAAQARDATSNLPAAPWLDVVYRRGA